TSSPATAGWGWTSTAPAPRATWSRATSSAWPPTAPRPWATACTASSSSRRPPTTPSAAPRRPAPARRAAPPAGGRRPRPGGGAAPAPGVGNVIAFNGGAGVVVGTDTAHGFLATQAGTGNAVLGNSIFANAGLGIDLGNADGVTPNDPGDADTGPNNFQNFP